MKIPQSIPVARRFTINQFNDLFPTNDACLDWLMEQRHPEGLAICAYCKVERKHHRIISKKTIVAVVSGGRSARDACPGRPSGT